MEEDVKLCRREQLLEISFMEQVYLITWSLSICVTDLLTLQRNAEFGKQIITTLLSTIQIRKFKTLLIAVTFAELRYMLAEETEDKCQLLKLLLHLTKFKLLFVADGISQRLECLMGTDSYGCSKWHLYKSSG